MKNVRGGKRLLAIMLAVCMLSQNVSLETFAAEKKTYDKEDMQTEDVTEKYEEEVETENLKNSEETEAENELVIETENESASQSIAESELLSESESLKQSEETEERSSNQSIEESSETEIAETEMIDSETTENSEDEGSTTTEGTETETEEDASEVFDVNTDVLSGKCGDNLTWTFEDGTLTISGTGEMYDFYYKYESGKEGTTAPWGVYASTLKKLVIEEGITRIGDYAFYRCNGFVGNLKIPNGVTEIGYRAFSNCGGFTGDLEIPEGITKISDYAFAGCNGFNGKLTLPNSITCISQGTFMVCNGLKGELKIPDSIVTIGYAAFMDCSGFTGSLKIPDKVTSVGKYAFGECSGFDGELIIGNSVSSIGDIAFMNCSGFTGNLVLPNNITEIGKAAFSGCSGFSGDLVIPKGIVSLPDAEYYTGEGYCGIFAGCSGFDGKLIIEDGITAIGSGAFKGCSGFTGNLTIPDSVSSIGGSAFESCSGFAGNLIIPNGVTSIEDGAFKGCSGFTGDLMISGNITSIGESAFKGCSGFTGDLIIPGSVTTIGGSAFEGCNGFAGNLIISEKVTTIRIDTFKGCSGFTGTLTIPSSVITIENNAFEGCSGFIGDLKIPEGVTEIYQYAFSGCSGFTGKLTLAESVNRIEAYAFSGCSGFTGSLKIPDNMTDIEQCTFEGCSGFDGDLVIGDNVITIWDGAFKDCNGFKGNLTISDKVQTIGYWPSNVSKRSYGAFSGCSGFTGSLKIPDSVISIGDISFLGCKGFRGDLVIPNSVTEIGYGAFDDCSGFSGNLTIGNHVTTISYRAFSGCSGFTGNLEIPNSVNTIVSDAFSGCSGFTGKLEIPNSVNTIDSNAFSGCSGFTGDLEIPNSVDTIGSNAFKGCSGFTGNLVISNCITTIEEGTFSGCSGFTGNLEIPNSVMSIGRNAFSECSGFTGSLIIPNSINNIDFYAFENCGFSKIYFKGKAPEISTLTFTGVTANVYYPSGLEGWDEYVGANFGGELTWIPYLAGTEPWLYDDSEEDRSKFVQAVIKPSLEKVEYDMDDGFVTEQFELEISVGSLFLTDEAEYKNVKVEITLPVGLSFSGTADEKTKTYTYDTLAGGDIRKNTENVFVQKDKITDKYEIVSKVYIENEIKSEGKKVIPINFGNMRADQRMIEAVEKYTSGHDAQVVLDIYNAPYTDEEKIRKLCEYFCYDNIYDVKENVIERLQSSSEERWAYKALITDEMYTSWQYYDYLNNNKPWGVAARASLYASGLVFNGELGAWLDPGTYIDGDYPGVKKYKSMLQEFINKQNQKIEFYEYTKEVERFVNSMVGTVSDLEKDEFLKSLPKDYTAIETLKSEFNDFTAVKLQGKDEIVIFAKEKTKFMEAMGIVGDAFKIADLTEGAIMDYMEITTNLELYNTWSSFLLEIYNAYDLPWEMRIAAYQLNDELRDAYLEPVNNILKTLRDECMDGALKAAGISKILKLNGALGTIDFAAFLVNQVVDIGAVVRNSASTEGYALLAKHYKNKLIDCADWFESHKNIDAAWDFYEAYNMLWAIRESGEEAYLKMCKLESGDFAKNDMADLLNTLTKYVDKEAVVNDILAMLKKCKFNYDTSKNTIPEKYKYLQKVVVECPVSVEILTDSDTSVCILPDGEETEITNDYGKFITVYRPTTGDYTKIAYFNNDNNYHLKVVGQSDGKVTYSRVITEDYISCEVLGFKDVVVSPKSEIAIDTDKNQYDIDSDGDGKTDIQGEIAAKDKIFVQFDYQNNQTIDVVYVGASGTVTLPETPTRSGYEFSGWYLEPQGQGEKFVNNMIKESVTVYAYWTESAKETLSAPSASITSGSAVERGTKVSLTCPAAGATIYYTTDGTDPTTESLCFTEPIEISQDMVIKAFAAKEGYKNSEIVTFTYTAIVEPNVYFVSFDSKGGSAVSGQNVEENAKATEPQAPTREGYRFLGWYLNGTLYDFDTPVTGDLTLEAGWEEYDSLPAPSSNIQSGSKVRKGTKISLTCAESGADIYYTTDGTEPTVESLRYTDPIEILTDITIRAFAVKEGYKSSEVVTFTYVVSDGSGEDEPGQDDNPEGVLPEDIPTDGIPEGLWIAGIDGNGYLYTGKAINPEVRVYDRDRRLTVGKDYTITYKNNTKANDAYNAKTAPSVVVKGKANYAGTETATFKILPVDLGSAEVLVEAIVVANNGKVQKKVPVLTFNGKKLANKKDFTVSYPATGQEAYKAAGIYDVLLTAKANGNFTGTRVVKLTVTDSTLISKSSVKKLANQPYTGEATMPKPKVTYKGKLLSEGTDYTLAYENNTEIGTATVILTGIGAYAGTKKVTFKITGTSLKGAKVTVADTVYDGSAQTPKPQVELNGATLREGEDYTVAYQNNIKAGKATITISGIKSYSGTLKKTFKITAYDLGQDADKALNGWNDALTAKYTKGGSKPKLQLQFKGMALIAGEDYTVSYSNNNAVTFSTTKKQPTVTIKGKGNFKGSLTKTFVITQKDLDDAEQPVRMMVADVPFKDKAGNYISKPVLTDTDGRKLVAGTDYEKKITYELSDKTPLNEKSKVDIGTVITVTVTGKGAYTGTRTATYCITKNDFSKAKISISPQIYTGKPIVLGEKDITVKIGNNPPLIYGVDYDIVADSYINNIKKGTASVTMIGKGNYGGMKQVKFKITAKKFSWFWRIFG